MVLVPFGTVVTVTCGVVVISAMAILHTITLIIAIVDFTGIASRLVLVPLRPLSLLRVGDL